MTRMPNLTVLAVAATLTATAAAQGWSLRNTLTAPAARNSHAMCYDVTRGVAVMFGGYDATLSARGDLWEWNGFGWVQRTTPSAPTARWGHGMAFDTRRNQAILFGGFVPGTGSVNDTWTWNGSAWQQVATQNAPAGRAYAGIAYDSIRGRVVVHGGLGNSQALLGDTWEFDGFDWAQSAASGPGGRRGPAMTFDDTRGQVVLFGGGDGTQTFGDTWTYDGLAWTQRATPTAPSPRWQAQIEHDTLCGRAVLHGGADATFANNFGDSWAWDGTSWTQLAGTSPQARHGAASAFDAQRGQTLLFGGRDAAGARNDTWQLGSPCSRTMSVVTAPQVGSTASFRFDYPGAAAGHFYFHLLAGHQPGSFSVPIPGLTSIGVSRVDLFNIYLQPSGLLDASGSNLLNVGIPPDNFLAGLPFDVQTVDFNFFTNTLYWANNDAEVVISNVPPVASFTATPTFGTVPLIVQFTDTSTNAPTAWQWDFDNNGTVDSTQQNPSFTYTTAGFYSVRLVAANLGGASISLRSSLIRVAPEPSPLLNMVMISSGTFQMGSNAIGGNAAPVHAVTITQPFWVGKYEVTQAEYQAVRGSNPSFHQGASYPNSPQRPVERVTWNDAMAYCSALTATETVAGRIPAGYQYRLPTEAEWEYVCRAGTTTEWNTGASLACGQANFSGCGPGQTTVVGSYPANPWGLFDTQGNVQEWCLDSWDGSANYPSSAVADPYVSSGQGRAFRGGSWGLGAGFSRSALRFITPFMLSLIGFRVVLAPVLVP
jgi:formylglycine-generating enzyme required for sulfatase activity